jgi:feruloyl-CoA synthase
MMAQVWPFLAGEPPVLLDWLPWSHTFGGNQNVNMVLTHGGTLWIDDGRPAGNLIGRTLRNLAEVSPTIHFNVPAGYGLLVPALEADPGLAERFFARLRLVFYAGSALPQALWDRIEALAGAAGRPIPMTTSWGCTETAPAATSAHFASQRSDCIGVPLPGVDLRLVPSGGKTEIRVRGPNVTPGYYRNDQATAAAFDEEGFYQTGDAGCLVDPANPGAGVAFDGRISEDFKLATGTWVSVGTLRTALLSASDGLLSDAVIAGHDGPYAAALAWLNPARAAPLAAALFQTGPAGLIDSPPVRAACAQALDRLNAGATGSSQRVQRLLLLADPPSLDHGEITDKGYLNQRAILDRRQSQVSLLLADPPGPGVLCWRRSP